MFKNSLKYSAVWLLIFVAGAALVVASIRSNGNITSMANGHEVAAAKEAEVSKSPSQKLLTADAMRWQAMADHYAIVELNPAQVAEAARLRGLAAYYSGLDARSIAAYSARLTGLAEAYSGSASLGFSRGQWADAARLTAMAIYFHKAPDNVSPTLVRLIAK